MQYIAIFENARGVIRAEKRCREEGIPVKVIPLPERYSSECGMALLFTTSHREEIDCVLKQLSIQAKIEPYE